MEPSIFSPTAFSWERGEVSDSFVTVTPSKSFSVRGLSVMGIETVLEIEDLFGGNGSINSRICPVIRNLMLAFVASLK